MNETVEKHIQRHSLMYRLQAQIFECKHKKLLLLQEKQQLLKKQFRYTHKKSEYQYECRNLKQKVSKLEPVAWPADKDSFAKMRERYDQSIELVHKLSRSRIVEINAMSNPPQRLFIILRAVASILDNKLLSGGSAWQQCRRIICNMSPREKFSANYKKYDRAILQQCMKEYNSIVRVQLRQGELENSLGEWLEALEACMLREGNEEEYEQYKQHKKSEKTKKAQRTELQQDVSELEKKIKELNPPIEKYQQQIQEVDRRLRELQEVMKQMRQEIRLRFPPKAQEQKSICVS